MKTTTNQYTGITSHQAETAEERALFAKLAPRRNAGHIRKGSTYQRKNSATNNRAYTPGRAVTVQEVEQLRKVVSAVFPDGKKSYELVPFEPRQYKRIYHTQIK